MKRGVLLGLVCALVLCLGAGIAGAASLQEIQDRGVVRIATADFNIPPLIMHQEDGTITGLDADMMAQIAEAMGVKLEMVPVPWTGGIDKAWNSDYGWEDFDIAVSSITIKDTRAAVCDFSDWYVTTGQMVGVPKGSSLKTPEDLKGKKVAVLGGSTGESTVKGKFADVEIVPLDTYEDCYAALFDGRADAFVADGTNLSVMVKENPDKLEAWDKLLTRERYGVAVPKNQPELKALVDGVMQKNRKPLYRKWFK